MSRERESRLMIRAIGDMTSLYLGDLGRRMASTGPQDGARPGYIDATIPKFDEICASLELISQCCRVALMSLEPSIAAEPDRERQEVIMSIIRARARIQQNWPTIGASEPYQRPMCVTRALLVLSTTLLIVCSQP